MSYKEEKKQWQEIRFWLGVRGINLSIYDKLPEHIKNVLHNCICVPVQTTTHRQRENLLRALQNVAEGRDSVDSLDHMTAEERERLLSPPTEKEKDDYLSKF